jgi:hypothetical protein
VQDDHTLHYIMGNKYLSTQDKLVIALALALLLSLGWGRSMPLDVQEIGRTLTGALTRNPQSRIVPTYDV